jgi:hypothetical protein
MMMEMSERTSSFWPLPGGYDHYLETLLNLLSKIAEEPTFQELIEWASKILNKKPNWLGNSIRIVIIYSGLAELKGDRIYLTEKGLEFLRTKNPETVLRAFLERIWGFREIVVWLNQEGPLTVEQIFEKCLDFGVEWQNDYQVRYRLMWLQTLGYIDRRQGKYLLTSAGEKMARNLLSCGLLPESFREETTIVAERAPEPAIAKPLEGLPSHSEMQNMLVELGTLEDYRAEKEFAVNSERLDVVWFRRIREKPDLAFEIQKGGNFYSALVKLKEAWDKWGCLSVLVTNQEYLEEAKRWLGRAFHEMEKDARIALWSEIAEWYEASKRRKEVKERLKIDP